MAETDSLTLETLDPILSTVVGEHKDKVVGWMRDEAGCWGFLAGKAVAACRQNLGRSLADPERKLVWDRFWWVLEGIKKEVLS